MLYWVTAVAALVGVWLNVKKHVACFYIWAVTNAIWVYGDVVHGILPQAALQFAYFLLSIYGIWKWTPHHIQKGEHHGR